MANSSFSVLGIGSGVVQSSTQNNLAYYAANGTTVSGLATGNNGILATNGSGVPSISTALPFIVPGTTGGTGVNNGASTITLGGSLTTSGAFASTFTMTNTTNVTFPTSGTLLTTASAASQADQETGTSTTTFTSPGRQQYHTSAAKFWIQYTSVTTTAITTSYNVTSITDNGTGDTTITYTVGFSSVNYCVVSGCQVLQGFQMVPNIFSNNTGNNPTEQALSATTCRIITTSYGGGFAFRDVANVCLAGFGDQA